MRATPATIRIELEIRVVFEDDTETRAAILEILRKAGGDLKAHILYRFADRAVGLFVAERPAEAALALKDAGFPVETETVVTLAAEHRRGLFAHLARTLAAEGITIGYSYSAAVDGRSLVVLRTDNNPKAEDVLRNFLVLPES